MFRTYLIPDVLPFRPVRLGDSPNADHAHGLIRAYAADHFGAAQFKVDSLPDLEAGGI